MDEASVSLTSFVAFTYAICGTRPVLKTDAEICRRLYLASGISPHGELCYTVREKPFDAAAVIEFLRQLLETYTGKLLIIWDNASIHNCAATRAFLAENPVEAARLHLVQQPTYSPELNADEQVWSQLKCVGLKNTCYRNVKELKPRLIQEMEKLKNNPELIKQFFHHPEVGFYN